MGGFSGFVSGMNDSGGLGKAVKKISSKMKKSTQGSKTDSSTEDMEASGGPPAGSFKKGGKVRKTGVYRLHKGERVLNPKQTRKYERRKKVY